MLPPFVPPAARVSSETFPLITEFVVDRVEHSFDSSFSLLGDSDSGAVATLPSIDDFAWDGGDSSGQDDEFVQHVSRGPDGAYEARHQAGEASSAHVARTAASALEPDLILTERRTPPSGSEDAIVNEIAEPAEAWAASAAGSGGTERAARAEAPTPEPAAAPVASSTAQAAPEVPEVWLAEERDAFDWHAVASLAVPPAEEQRAAEEWSSTEWDRSSGSVQDHVAALLAQLSRRLRAGELEVHGSKQMGPEAGLVAVLAALLAEQGRK